MANCFEICPKASISLRVADSVRERGGDRRDGGEGRTNEQKYKGMKKREIFRDAPRRER